MARPVLAGWIDKEDTMFDDGFFLLVFAWAVVVVLVIAWCWRRAASGGPVSLTDLRLLWPLLFKVERLSEKPTRRWSSSSACWWVSR